MWLWEVSARDRGRCAGDSFEAEQERQEQETGFLRCHRFGQLAKHLLFSFFGPPDMLGLCVKPRESPIPFALVDGLAAMHSPSCHNFD